MAPVVADWRGGSWGAKEGVAGKAAVCGIPEDRDGKLGTSGDDLSVFGVK